MASYNYTIRYRKFEDLLADVKMDFKNFSLEGKISPEALFKVAMRVTYDLGLRVNTTKEKVLPLDNFKARLPEDFFVMNYALICGEHTVRTIVPQGTNIQSIPYPQYNEVPGTVNTCAPITVNCVTCNQLPCNCNSASCLTCNQLPCNCPTPVYDPNNPYGNTCIKPRVYLDCKGDAYELIQILKTETRVFKYLYPVRFTNSQFIDCDCPNLRMQGSNTASIKDGFIFSSLREGNFYINYQGGLVDDDGELLVVDHPMLNDYYEYALKSRILENLLMEGENVGPQIQMIEQRLRSARTNALSIVNTPNFSELLELHLMNRKAMYSKYYDMFKSFPGQLDTRINKVI